MGRLITVLALLASWTCMATAAPGDTAQGTFQMGVMRVPLPAGTWTVAADLTAPEPPARMRSVVLVQVIDRQVKGVVLARGNTAPLTAIYGSSAECDRSDIYLAYTAYDTPQDGLCVFINLVAPGGEVAPVWTEALAWLRGQGIAVGETWMMAGIRARVKPRVLDVRYHFPPPGAPAAVLPWADSPWTPARITPATPRAEAVEQMGVFAAWMRDAVEAGVRGRPDPTALPPPPFATDLLPLLIAARLAPLEQLREAGAITGLRYETERNALARPVIVPERSEMPLWMRSMWKTFTYRVGSIADSLAVSYLVLGSVAQTLGFAVVGEIVRPPAVYLHEMAWARSGIGRAAAPAKPQELPDIGAVK